MRSLFPLLLLLLLLVATLPSLARAQTRVVGDTFKEGRESHLQDSEDLREQFKQQGAVMLDERKARAEEVDRDRIVHRELGDQMATQWNNDWNNDGPARDAARAGMEADRAAHRDALAPRPAQWWGLDTPAEFDDIDDGGFNQ